MNESLKIYQFFNNEDKKTLEIKCTPIILDDDFQTIKELFEPMRMTTDYYRWVWLSANQIWITKRFFLLNYKNPRMIINPEILKYEWIKISTEWCLSRYGENPIATRRFEKIYVQYQDCDMNIIKEKLTWLESYIFQHELEHLDWINRDAETFKIIS